MLRVYYAMLVTTYVSNDDIMCDGGECVENECSADCGLARLIARVSVAKTVEEWQCIGGAVPVCTCANRRRANRAQGCFLCRICAFSMSRVG